jgi:hypothetical protein
MREIKESDWKIFRQLHKVALERFCERILSEIERVNADSAKTAHQKYLEIYDLTRRRDKEVAELFNDLRRSTAFFQIAAMEGRDLFTKEEFLRFSQETRNLIDVLLGRSE